MKKLNRESFVVLDGTDNSTDKEETTYINDWQKLSNELSTFFKDSDKVHVLSEGSIGCLIIYHNGSIKDLFTGTSSKIRQAFNQKFKTDLHSLVSN